MLRCDAIYDLIAAILYDYRSRDNGGIKSCDREKNTKFAVYTDHIFVFVRICFTFIVIIDTRIKNE